jgi:fumarylacetoacetate (FAA) hydrolase family protein
MTQLTRDPRDLVAQTIGPHHGYPDGFVLYLGTMFTPTADRGGPGTGFTHHADDVVTISTPTLGALVNRVRPAHLVEPWRFGVADLVRALIARLERSGRGRHGWAARVVGRSGDSPGHARAGAAPRTVVRRM